MPLGGDQLTKTEHDWEHLQERSRSPPPLSSRHHWYGSQLNPVQGHLNFVSLISNVCIPQSYLGWGPQGSSRYTVVKLFQIYKTPDPKVHTMLQRRFNQDCPTSITSRYLECITSPNRALPLQMCYSASSTFTHLDEGTELCSLKVMFVSVIGENLEVFKKFAGVCVKFHVL